MTAPPFLEWPPIARLASPIIITEKLDGTNAQVYIGDDGRMLAGSRSRWITPDDDNFGFARWVETHADALRDLGSGHHFGEWWGAGIQRRYGIGEKRFSLFNVGRWADDTVRPACCHVVPTLFRGLFDTNVIAQTLDSLRRNGSVASPGFLKPEGVVIWHEKSRASFKQTLDGDGHKGAQVQP